MRRRRCLWWSRIMCWWRMEELKVELKKEKVDEKE